MTSIGGNDPVNPSHYDGDQCMRAIEECTKGLTGSEGFLIGVIIKYLWRWKEKDGLHDLNKAKWYLDRLITNSNSNTNTVYDGLDVGRGPDEVVYRTSELCASCGRYCPEGRQVCEMCEIRKDVIAKGYRSDIVPSQIDVKA